MGLSDRWYMRKDSNDNYINEVPNKNKGDNTMPSKLRCRVKECPNKAGKTVCGLSSKEYDTCRELLKRGGSNDR